MLHKAYRFRLRVTTEQAKALTNIAGSCRFIYNHFLAIQKDLYEQRKATGDTNIKFLSYVKTAGMLTELKKEEKTNWLKEPPSQVLQQSLLDLRAAIFDWMNGRKGFPRFKKKGVHDSFRVPDGFKVDERTARVKLPKIGWIRYRKSRETKGTIRSLTVSREGKHWYVSILTQQEEQAFHPKDSSIGIDLGVKHFATLSTGEHIDAPKLTKYEKRITKLQKQLSHKQKGSNNFKKAKQKLNSVYRKLRHVRLDFLHKVSTTIAKNHSYVAMEDLKISNMMKSAKGTVENPGTNVSVKRGLNRAIGRQAWGVFRNLLEYKLKFLGGKLKLVDPKYTSQICPNCLTKNKNNRLSQSEFKCVVCGYSANADANAAYNILRLSFGYGVSPQPKNDLVLVV